MYEHNSILRLFPINEAASCLNKKVKILNYNFPLQACSPAKEPNPYWTISIHAHDQEVATA